MISKGEILLCLVSKSLSCMWILMLQGIRPPLSSDLPMTLFRWGEYFSGTTHFLQDIFYSQSSNFEYSSSATQRQQQNGDCRLKLKQGFSVLKYIDKASS